MLPQCIAWAGAQAILNPIHLPNDMSIGLAEANRAIHAALAKAHNLAVKISVAVCDANGRLVAFQRMDGALAEADLASVGKALASVRSGRPSGDQSIEASEYFRAATVTGEAAPRLRRPGGLPIIRAGQVEGALGVAGVSDDQAVECALAGIDALEEKGDR
jgi:glc operon protein GlcG